MREQERGISLVGLPRIFINFNIFYGPWIITKIKISRGGYKKGIFKPTSTRLVFFTPRVLVKKETVKRVIWFVNVLSALHSTPLEWKRIKSTSDSSWKTVKFLSAFVFSISTNFSQLYATDRITFYSFGGDGYSVRGRETKVAIKSSLLRTLQLTKYKKFYLSVYFFMVPLLMLFKQRA